MKTPERIIFVPLGDKTHENLDASASYEARVLIDEITREEDEKGRWVKGIKVSLQKHPRANLIHHLKKGITSLGGYLVKIEEVKIPRRT